MPVSKPSGRVNASYIVALCALLEAQQVDVPRLLRMAGIERERFAKSGATLVHAELDAFLGAARQLTGRTDLGFEMGRCIKMTSHDLLGYAMLSSKNIDQMMRLVSRHYHLMTTLFTLRYRRMGGIGEALYSPATAMPLEMLRFGLEAVAVSHQNQMELLLGDRLGGYDIHLSIPEPPHLKRYFSLAPARFHFDEHATPGVRVRMEASMLDAALPLAAQQVVEQLEERLQAQRVRPAPDGNWGDFVLMMLREARGQQLTLDDIAQRLQVSARTIARALKKEDLEFRDMSQQVMFEQAQELLRIEGSTVSQVADDLGFSAVSNFSRAFRRLAGVSPAEFQSRNDSGTTPGA